MSSIPGSTHLPAASTTRGQPVSSSGSSETATTLPSRMPRSRSSDGAPVPSNQRPPLTITSYVMGGMKSAQVASVKDAGSSVLVRRQREPLHQHVPGLLVTAHVGPDERALRGDPGALVPDEAD